MRFLTAQQPRHAIVFATDLGQHKQSQQEQRDSTEQQQELFEPDPSAIFSMALEQELHRGPFDFFVPHHVDQVDQDRQANAGGDQAGPHLRAGRKNVFKHN